MNGIDEIVTDRMLRELKKVEHLHSRVSSFVSLRSFVATFDGRCFNGGLE